MTSTLTKWQKTFYIETLVTFVFKYRNLCKLYWTYLSTITVLIATFCLAMLKANGVVQSLPDPLLQAPEDGSQTSSTAGRLSRQRGGLGERRRRR